MGIFNIEGAAVPCLSTSDTSTPRQKGGGQRIARGLKAIKGNFGGVFLPVKYDDLIKIPDDRAFRGDIQNLMLW